MITRRTARVVAMITRRTNRACCRVTSDSPSFPSFQVLERSVNRACEEKGGEIGRLIAEGGSAGTPPRKGTAEDLEQSADDDLDLSDPKNALMAAIRKKADAKKKVRAAKDVKEAAAAAKEAADSTNRIGVDELRQWAFEFEAFRARARVEVRQAAARRHQSRLVVVVLSRHAAWRCFR